MPVSQINSPSRYKVFLSYAHKDTDWKPKRGSTAILTHFRGVLKRAMEKTGLSNDDVFFDAVELMDAVK